MCTHTLYCSIWDGNRHWSQGHWYQMSSCSIIINNNNYPYMYTRCTVVYGMGYGGTDWSQDIGTKCWPLVSWMYEIIMMSLFWTLPFMLCLPYHFVFISSPPLLVSALKQDEGQVYSWWCWYLISCPCSVPIMCVCVCVCVCVFVCVCLYTYHP